ncbi:putative transposase (putative), gypsy type [Senna tora]|uniref:Putative transposase (Putative), gypsy type n=1 Tax=Senna tora TaxID=362788 RepID=A0A834T2C1_9FABA|nr:putative transposase (putative), gypsy type [Senna tora]
MPSFCRAVRPPIVQSFELVRCVFELPSSSAASSTVPFSLGLQPCIYITAPSFHSASAFAASSCWFRRVILVLDPWFPASRTVVHRSFGLFPLLPFDLLSDDSRSVTSPRCRFCSTPWFVTPFFFAIGSLVCRVAPWSVVPTLPFELLLDDLDPSFPRRAVFVSHRGSPFFSVDLFDSPPSSGSVVICWFCGRCWGWSRFRAYLGIILIAASLPMAVSGDSRASIASSSSDEDFLPSVVAEPWLVHRYTHELFFGDLSWLDDSISTHKSSLCRVGRVRLLWKAFFSHLEKFFRASFGDDIFSLGLSLATPCLDESIFYGPPGSFGFYLFPLDQGFVMPPFSNFEVGVLSFLGCAPSIFPPNCWLYLGGFQAICAKLKITPTVEFPCEWALPSAAHPRLELDEMSSASVDTITALEGKSYRFHDLITNDGGFRYVPGRSQDANHLPRPSSARGSSSRRNSRTTNTNFEVGGKQPFAPPRSSVSLCSRGLPPSSKIIESSGKRKACLDEDISSEGSCKKKGKEVQTGSESGKEKRSFSDHP